VTHDEALQRLPDLLDDRDDPELLGHVRACAVCQRQLFLLGRIDRMLRVGAPTRQPRSRARVVAAAAGAAAIAAAAAFALLLLPQASRGQDFMLRTSAGRPVGHALMSHSDARNDSLALTARGLPLDRDHVFILWAGDEGASMEVGRFMVDRFGGCRVRFNLPATHAWRRFWVTKPGNEAAVVAST
jgi:hypothetical protein